MPCRFFLARVNGVQLSDVISSGNQWCRREVSALFSQVRDGPLENLWGGAGEVQKKNSRKGKLNEKKFLQAN